LVLCARFVGVALAARSRTSVVVLAVSEEHACSAPRDAYDSDSHVISTDGDTDDVIARNDAFGVVFGIVRGALLRLQGPLASVSVRAVACGREVRACARVCA
jgi:hypothetical protein